MFVPQAHIFVAKLVLSTVSLLEWGRDETKSPLEISGKKQHNKFETHQESTKLKKMFNTVPLKYSQRNGNAIRKKVQVK